MNVPQALAQQFGFVYGVIGRNLEGMTQHHSIAQPPQGGNCANWILGHVTNVQNGVMSLLGEAPVWQSEQLAHAGFEPIRSQTHAIDWDTMRSQFLASRERCIAAIAALPEQKLAETVPHPFGGTCTRGELLTTLAFHQAYHAGQLGMCRRVAGLEGAIKAPGQAQAQAQAQAQNA